MSDADLRERARLASTPLERLRLWAELARRGDVSEPRAAIEAVYDRANLDHVYCTDCHGNGTVFTGAFTAPRQCGSCKGSGLRPAEQADLLAGRVPGAVDKAFLPNLLRRAFSRRWTYDKGDTRDGAVGSLTCVLAVRLVGLVTVGAARGEKYWRGRASKWFTPADAWPEELAPWSTQRGKNGAPVLSKPTRKRVETWAERAAPDRVQLDALTARALALSMFAEPFDAKDSEVLRA